MKDLRLVFCMCVCVSLQKGALAIPRKRAIEPEGDAMQPRFTQQRLREGEDEEPASPVVEWPGREPKRQQLTLFDPSGGAWPRNEGAEAPRPRTTKEDKDVTQLRIDSFVVRRVSVE